MVKSKKAIGLMAQARPIMSMVIEQQIEDKMQKEGLTREKAGRIVNEELEKKVAEVKKEFFAERAKARMKAEEISKSRLVNRRKKIKAAIGYTLAVIVFIVTILAMMSGCFNPDLSDVQFTCSAENKLCLAGQSCNVDLGICEVRTESDLKATDSADLALGEPSKCSVGFTEKKVSTRASICTGLAYSGISKPCARTACTEISIEERTNCELLAERVLINKDGSFSSNIGAAQCGDTTGIFRIRYGCGSKLRSAPECSGAIRAIICRFPEGGIECDSGTATGAVLCC